MILAMKGTKSVDRTDQVARCCSGMVYVILFSSCRTDLRALRLLKVKVAPKVRLLIVVVIQVEARR